MIWKFSLANGSWESLNLVANSIFRETNTIWDFFFIFYVKLKNLPAKTIISCSSGMYSTWCIFLPSPIRQISSRSKSTQKRPSSVPTTIRSLSIRQADNAWLFLIMLTVLSRTSLHLKKKKIESHSQKFLNFHQIYIVQWVKIWNKFNFKGGCTKYKFISSKRDNFKNYYKYFNFHFNFPRARI